MRRKVIIEHKGDLHPQIVIEDDDGNILGSYSDAREGAHRGRGRRDVSAGMLLAKTPREITGTQDITGGLPRVTELFEARKPKDPAVMSEIDGVVELRREAPRQDDHHRPQRSRAWSASTSCRTASTCACIAATASRAGEALTEGPLVPQDILRISGEEEVQQYLLREMQNVYRSQNVSINDKHIEIIVSRR